MTSSRPTRPALGTARPAALLLALFAPAAAALEQWVELTPEDGPEPWPRSNASSIYDPVAHRLVIFAGATSTGVLDDVWAFDLATLTWEELAPVGGSGPPARFTANAVYDPEHYRMLVWSGQGAAFFNDVWAFDLSTHTWTELLPSDPKPNIRYGTAAVFDPDARNLVTFAGFTDQGRFQDTWTFDVDGVAWANATPAEGSPGRRCLHSASYDPVGRRMIMYGGQRSGALADIWAFDLAAGTWSQFAPPTPPAGRWFSPQDYDGTRNRVLVFGGNRNSSLSNQVLAFDLGAESWSEVLAEGPAPAPRQGASAHYLIHEDRLIVFAGNTPTHQNDVWALDFSAGELLAFPAAITAGVDGGLGWPVPANVDWVRGPLEQIAAYVTDRVETATWVTTIDDPELPAPGQGFYYLTRLHGPTATWQSSPGAEPARDATLP